MLALSPWDFREASRAVGRIIEIGCPEFQPEPRTLRTECDPGLRESGPAVHTFVSLYCERQSGGTFSFFFFSFLAENKVKKTKTS